MKPKTTKTMFTVEQDYNGNLSIRSVEVTFTDKLARFQCGQASGWRSQIELERIGTIFSATPELAARAYIKKLTVNIEAVKSKIGSLENRLYDSKTQLEKYLCVAPTPNAPSQP